MLKKSPKRMFLHSAIVMELRQMVSIYIRHQTQTIPGIGIEVLRFWLVLVLVLRFAKSEVLVLVLRFAKSEVLVLVLRFNIPKVLKYWGFDWYWYWVGYNTFGHLKYHKMIHTGEKPYGSSNCKRRFSWSCHLKVHEASHTSNKPLSC